MPEMCKLEVLAEYDFSKDPFEKGFFVMETADSLRLKRVMKMAIESRAMLSIVAGPGTGKTSTFDLIFAEIPVHKVHLETADKERVVISDIEKGVILGLSNEACKRTKEVRARQIKRILGEASSEKPVVLILEEAHRMHGQTLRALKTLREMKWKGKSPLFTVVMIGQYDPLRKRGVEEVRLRTDSLQMRGMTASEVVQYIKGTVGKCFEEDAIEAISRLPQGRNYLELQEALITLMGKALAVGSKKVTALEVYEVFGGGIKEVMKRANISLAEIHEMTGIPKPTLSLVTNDTQGTLSDSKFSDTRLAIASVLREKLEGKKTTKLGAIS